MPCTDHLRKRCWSINCIFVQSNENKFFPLVISLFVLPLTTMYIMKIINSNDNFSVYIKHFPSAGGECDGRNCCFHLENHNHCSVVQTLYSLIKVWYRRHMNRVYVKFYYQFIIFGD